MRFVFSDQPAASFRRWLGGTFLPLVLLTATVLCRPAVSEDAGRVERMQQAIQYLASDELEGRGVGTEGLDQAADYLVSEFSKLGLQTHEQSFEVITKAGLGPADSNQLALVGPQRPDGSRERVDFELGEDFSPLAIGGSGAIDAPLVFAGYGITARDAHYDDYAAVDVKGKVVILLRKEPRQDDEDSPFEGKQSSRHAYFSSKVSNAYEHGAAAVILVNDFYSVAQSRQTARQRWQETLDTLVDLRTKFQTIDQPAEEQLEEHREAVGKLVEQLHQFQQRLSKPFDEILTLEGAGQESSHEKMPVLFARRELLDQAVKAASGKDLATLEQEIDEQLAPQSFELTGWKAIGQTRIEHERAQIRNVIAVLEGSGPLKDETVILGAHYDHLGLGGPGSLAPWTKEIHNGADDNASGTVALLEIARRFVESEEKPARRLVFIAFAGEERGLLGSAHYVREPLFPLERTVAMLNMDMVGRLSDNKLIVHGTGTAKEFDALIDELNKLHQFEITREPGGFGPSDHASFYGKNIPVLHFFTGTHNDYHRPSDDYEKINLDGMVRIVDMVAGAMEAISSRPQRPEYLEVARKPMGGGGDRPYFGSIPDFGRQVEGYALMGVTKDSPAERGGLRAGDVIIKLGESRIGGLEDFDSALRKYKAGDEVAVTALRDGKEVEVKITLDPPR